MKRIMLMAMLLCMTFAAFAQDDAQTTAQDNGYGFSLPDKQGREVSLSAYKGKVLLIVNTATGCGFTPQYKQLEEIYNKYKDQGFEILDIPCNQFGHQAPGSDEEITQFCTEKYHTTFPQFQKSEVNGTNALPLYGWLKAKKGVTGSYAPKLTKVMEKLYNKVNTEPRGKDDIQWNFTKFLINRKGEVLARFEPTDDMTIVEAAVAEAVAEKQLRTVVRLLSVVKRGIQKLNNAKKT